MKYTMLFILFLSQMASAAFFERAWKYLHIPTGRVIELRDSNPATGMARVWYTNELVKLSDLSREKDGEQQGVEAGEMILVKTPGSLDLRSCEAFYLFENGNINFGCLDKWHVHEWGRDPIISRWNIKAQFVVPEVKSLGGFEKKSCAVLKKTVQDLDAGDSVRVDVIFANGEALVRNMGFNLVDTTQPLLSSWMRRTHVSNLLPCPVVNNASEY